MYRRWLESNKITSKVQSTARRQWGAAPLLFLPPEQTACLQMVSCGHQLETSAGERWGSACSPGSYLGTGSVPGQQQWLTVPSYLQDGERTGGKQKLYLQPQGSALGCQAVPGVANLGARHGLCPPPPTHTLVGYPAIPTGVVAVGGAMAPVGRGAFPEVPVG